MRVSLFTSLPLIAKLRRVYRINRRPSSQISLHLPVFFALLADVTKLACHLSQFAQLLVEGSDEFGVDA